MEFFICKQHRWRGHQFPVAVPEKICGLTLVLDFFDRCHSLTSLYLPQAALGSLPGKIGNANTRTSTVMSRFFAPATVHRTVADGATIHFIYQEICTIMKPDQALKPDPVF